jgi:3-hydroxy-9,10-secoandrosta-1,3,5(10)-triene-9,17-dione monooxygenase
MPMEAMHEGTVSSEAANSLIERARSLAPILAEQASESERLRRPSDVAIEALRDSGVLEMMVPKMFGGLELDLDTFLEVGLALGEGDASLAWIATFYIEHNWILCQFPERFQRELYSDRSSILAPAALAPNGIAERVDGGFRLNGRWQWGTGVMHAEWVLVGARVDSESGTPDFRFLALPRDEVEVEDVWFVDGMSGTGSNDILVEGAIVPEERSVSLLDMSEGKAHGATLHAGPLYRTPMLPILCLAASMPAVGQARAAVNAFRNRIQERVLVSSGSRQMESPAAQMRLARAEIEARQAEGLLREVVADVRRSRNAATVADRARWSAAAAFAVDQSKRVLLSLAEASGASAHFRKDPLQRAVRDVNTLSCHMIFDLDKRLEIHGRTLLGLEPGGMV